MPNLLLRTQLAALATCVLLMGCGTGSYETLEKTRLGALQTSAPFKQLFSASELPGTPVKVRVPQSFAASYAENSPHPDDGPVIKADRLKPPAIPLPGFKLCYEGTAQGPDGLLPYYCYLCAFPGGPLQAIEEEGKIRKAVNEAYGSAAAWEDASAPTPDGANLAWKKISVAGEMLFDNHSGDNVPDNAEYKKMPGKLELWMYQANGWVVLIGWREPDAISSTSNLSALAPLTAGSIDVGQAAPAAGG